MKYVCLVMALLVVTACSNQAVYENLQHHERNKCLEQPPGTVEECLDRVSQRYEDYQRERQQVLKPSGV